MILWIHLWKLMTIARVLSVILMLLDSTNLVKPLSLLSIFPCAYVYYLYIPFCTFLVPCPVYIYNNNLVILVYCWLGKLYCCCKYGEYSTIFVGIFLSLRNGFPIEAARADNPLLFFPNRFFWLHYLPGVPMEIGMANRYHKSCFFSFSTTTTKPLVIIWLVPLLNSTQNK